MLWTIALILSVLWVVGVISSFTLGGFIHVLLALAAAAFLIQMFRKPRAI